MSISLVGLAGCTSAASAPPAFEPFSPLPMEVTVNQISSDYAADEAAADAKYSVEKLLFYEVAVEEVKIKENIIDPETGIFGVGITEVPPCL